MREGVDLAAPARGGGRHGEQIDARVLRGDPLRALARAVGRAVVEHADEERDGLGEERHEAGLDVLFFVAHRQQSGDQG